MIDHSVNKFFETLFWIGAFLVMISLFQPKWFLPTITVGIALMVMATLREGFRLMEAKTFVGVIQKNEPKLIHRFVLLIIVICIFVYLIFRQTLILNPLKQFYDMTRAPAIMTWWVFVLIGIIIGIMILIVLTRAGKIRHEKIISMLKAKYSQFRLEKKPKEKKPEVKKEERPIAKQVAVKRQSFFATLWNKIIIPIQRKMEQKRIRRLKEQQASLQKGLEQMRVKQLKEQQARAEELKKKKLEGIKGKTSILTRIFKQEKSFWKKIFAHLLEKLRKNKLKKLEEQKAKIEQLKKEKPSGKYATVKIKPGVLSRIAWEEKSFWGKILAPLQKRLEQKRIAQLKEQQVRIEEIKKKKLEGIQEKSKKEKIVIETEIKHPALPRLFITLFILAITVILILHRKGKFSIENPISAAILGLVFGLFALYIFKNVYKARQEHKVKEEKKEKVLKKIKQQVIAKASKYETDVDKFYTLINEVENLTLTEAADVFGVSKEQVEEWGKILESHGMIELEYPAMGELRLCKKKLKTTE